MIRRIMLASVIKPGMEEDFLESLRPCSSAFGQSLVSKGFKLASVFRMDRLLIVYAELEISDIEAYNTSFWSAAQRKMLEPWPGCVHDLYECRLNDIFHDDEPLEDVAWRGSRYKAEHRVGSLAQLKPEMYASYVFLHYQLQEELPRQFNKYYMIGSMGQLLFSYQELPAIREAPRKGFLSTHQSPADWEGAMLPHFEPWTDTDERQRLWRELEEVFTWELQAE